MLPRHTVEVSHNGLGKYRVVSGTDYFVVQAKAKAFQLSWDEEYRRKQAKPLTLMNGANLLYLLEKHGHKAKIDIAEAKRILNEKPF